MVGSRFFDSLWILLQHYSLLCCECAFQYFHAINPSKPGCFALYITIAAISISFPRISSCHSPNCGSDTDLGLDPGSYQLASISPLSIESRTLHTYDLVSFCCLRQLSCFYRQYGSGVWLQGSHAKVRFTSQFTHVGHEVSALSPMPDTNSATRAYGGTIFEKDGEVIRHGVRDMPCF